MRKGSKQIAGKIGLSLACATTLIALVLLSKGAPVYQGQTIEKLFAALSSESQAEQNQADAAFAFFGKDSLPYLISQVEAGRPKATDRLQSWAKANILCRPEIASCGLGQVSEAFGRQSRLVRAFQILGDRAMPAIPRLGKLLDEPYCANEAAIGLVAIGPASFQQLEQAIGDNNVEVRRTVASALGEAKAARTNLVSLLLKAMKDPDALVRHYAAHSVGQLVLGPKESVAALVTALDDSDSRVRYIAIHALSKFGPDALPALPMLNKLESDHEESVRKSAVEVAQGLRGFFHDTQHMRAP